MTDGQETAPGYSLRRENGQWRIDLVEFIESVMGDLSATAASQGKTEDELILQSLERYTGTAPGPDIWNPPQAAPPSN